VDDNARALITAVMHYEQFGDAEALALARSYLEFLRFSQREDGKFHNFCDYQGVFLDEEGSEDSFGRAIWACGYVTASPALDSEFKRIALEMLLRAFPNILDLEHLRAQAFSALGLYYYLQSAPHAETARQAMLVLGEGLMQSYRIASTQEWEWFEDKLTYCNARLPQALYLAYRITGEKEFLEVAEKTTFFLIKNQVKDGVLLVVGNRGWFSRGGEFPLYDQQPVDAGCMVELMVTAYEVTDRKEYLELGELCFEWFMGRNIASGVLCDPQSGACRDGLNKDIINPNRGAESTISYLLASLILRRHLSELPPGTPRLLVTDKRF
jgi:hypothetical protein